MVAAESPSSRNQIEGLAARLKQARAALKMTQKEFCATYDMKLPSLRDYEIGNRIPGGEAIATFIRAGINANWLLTGDGAMLLKDRRIEPPSPKQAGELVSAFEIYWRKAADEYGVDKDVAMNGFVPDYNNHVIPWIDGYPGISKSDINAAYAWLSHFQAEPHTHDSAMDARLMKQAIETVEEGLAATGKEMAPAKKAELVLAVYELFSEGGEAKKATILRLVKAA